jgi:hypothetical protein
VVGPRDIDPELGWRQRGLPHELGDAGTGVGRAIRTSVP